MPQNPNEQSERPRQNPESMPEMQRERDAPGEDDIKGFEEDDEFDDDEEDDLDPDSADSENDRDDTLTD